MRIPDVDRGPSTRLPERLRITRRHLCRTPLPAGNSQICVPISRRPKAEPHTEADNGALSEILRMFCLLLPSTTCWKSCSLEIARRQKIHFTWRSRAQKSAAVAEKSVRAGSYLPYAQVDVRQDRAKQQFVRLGLSPSFGNTLENFFRN